MFVVIYVNRLTFTTKIQRLSAWFTKRSKDIFQINNNQRHLKAGNVKNQQANAN